MSPRNHIAALLAIVLLVMSWLAPLSASGRAVESRGAGSADLCAQADFAGECSSSTRDGDCGEFAGTSCDDAESGDKHSDCEDDGCALSGCDGVCLCCSAGAVTPLDVFGAETLAPASTHFFPAPNDGAPLDLALAVDHPPC
jgi:hypothetical protein